MNLLQVQELAHSKYGGEEGIEARRAKQLTASADRRTQKRAKQAEQVGCWFWGLLHGYVCSGMSGRSGLSRSPSKGTSKKSGTLTGWKGG